MTHKTERLIRRYPKVYEGCFLETISEEQDHHDPYSDRLGKVL